MTDLYTALTLLLPLALALALPAVLAIAVRLRSRRSRRVETAHRVTVPASSAARAPVAATPRVAQDVAQRDVA